MVTDVAIPEGHKGLHQALYGEGSEEAHSAAQYALRKVCLRCDRCHRLSAGLHLKRCQAFMQGWSGLPDGTSSAARCSLTLLQ